MFSLYYLALGYAILYILLTQHLLWFSSHFDISVICVSLIQWHLVVYVNGSHTLHFRGQQMIRKIVENKILLISLVNN